MLRFLLFLYYTLWMCTEDINTVLLSYRFAGQVWCPLQRWSVCKYFWSTSWHLEGRQEEEGFDLWRRAASARCSWQCGDNPVASSRCCCRLKRTTHQVLNSIQFICLYFSVPRFLMNHLVFPEDCYCVMYEIVVLKKLPCLRNSMLV